jgi:hypothetical protein|tara:strand:- start:1449 stop:1733 length:285 start_codon:yes stop_codon:yes gene_type:complete
MNELKLQTKKKIIQDKGLDKIQSYFDLSVEQLKELGPETLKHFHQAARLGMQFEKEINLSMRANEMNFIRVGKLITENKEEMKKFLKRALPKYC